jgi:hypothetical protein
MFSPKDKKNEQSAALLLTPLRTNNYPFWREKTMQTLEVNKLIDLIAPTYQRFVRPIYPPCGANLVELKFRRELERDDNDKMDKSDFKNIFLYNGLSNAIPDQFRSNWTKGILESKDLWVKIETMCHFVQDYNLKTLYKNKYDSITCRSNSLLDITNYEDSLIHAINDHEEAGGYISMDDKINKVKKEIKKFKEIFSYVFTLMLDEGDDIIGFPSTNGWTITQMFFCIKKYLHAQDGPDYIDEQNSKRVRRSSMKTPGSFKIKSVRFEKQRDFNNKNRKYLREQLNAGRYQDRDNRNSYNPRKHLRVSKSSTPYFKHKRTFNKRSNKGFTNSIDSKGAPAEESETKFHNSAQPRANYDVKGSNNKFVNKTKQYKSNVKKSSNGVGKRVANYKNFGSGIKPVPKRPYTDPYCDICNSKGHYHYQCDNYRKNKEARPKDGKTMSVISYCEYRFPDSHINGANELTDSYSKFIERDIEYEIKALKNGLPVLHTYDEDSLDSSSQCSSCSSNSNSSYISRVTPNLTLNLDQLFDDSFQEHFTFGSFLSPVIYKEQIIDNIPNDFVV